MNNDIANTLQIEKYIELFVEFYGEENRRLIEDKIGSVEILYVDSLVSKDEKLDKQQYDAQVQKEIENSIRGLNIKGNVQEYIDEVTVGTDPYITPYCVEQDGKIEGKRLFVLPKGQKLDDHVILHELNHVLSSYFANITNDGYDFICGLEKLHTDFAGVQFGDEQLDNKGKRGTEWLNEIFNDYVTTTIIKSMKEKNYSIHGTDFDNSYRLAFPIMKTFLQASIKKLRY